MKSLVGRIFKHWISEDCPTSIDWKDFHLIGWAAPTLDWSVSCIANVDQIMGDGDLFRPGDHLPGLGIGQVKLTVTDLEASIFAEDVVLDSDIVDIRRIKVESPVIQ